MEDQGNTFEDIIVFFLMMSPIFISALFFFVIIIILYHVSRAIYTGITKKEISPLGFWGHFFMGISVLFTVSCFFIANYISIYIIMGIVISYMIIKNLYPDITKRKLPKWINFWNYYTVMLVISNTIFFMYISTKFS